MDADLEKLRRQYEAKYWLHQYKLQRKNNGKKIADDWWKERMDSIKLKRGEKGFGILINDIKEMIHNEKQKNSEES